MNLNVFGYQNDLISFPFYFQCVEFQISFINHNIMHRNPFEGLLKRKYFSCQYGINKGFKPFYLCAVCSEIRKKKQHAP